MDAIEAAVDRGPGPGMVTDDDLIDGDLLVEPVHDGPDTDGDASGAGTSMGTHIPNDGGDATTDAGQTDTELQTASATDDTSGDDASASPQE